MKFDDKKILINFFLVQVVFVVLSTSVAVFAASSDEYLQNAKAFEQKGELKAAIIELKNSLQKDAKNVEARFLLGSIYIKLGDGASAEKELERALRLGAVEKDIVVKLAKSYMLQGQAQRVLDEIKTKKLFADDVNAEIYAIQGQAYILLKENDKAGISFEKALKLNPKSVSAQLGMARNSIIEKKIKRAEQYVQNALKLDSKNDNALALYGEILRLQGDLKGAAKKFNQSVKLNTYNLAAHLGGATVLISMGKFDDAIKGVNAVRKLAPNHPMANYLYAVIFYKKRNFDTALDSLQLVLRAFPNHIPSLQLEGTMHYAKRQFEQAGQSLSKVVAVQPENIGAIKLLAATRIHLKQADDAVRIMEPLASKYEDDTQFVALLGGAYMQIQGKQEQGLEYLTKAAELSPDIASVQTQLALAQLATGKQSEAIEQLESTVKLDSGLIQADVLLVMVHLKNHDYKNALKQAKRIQKKQAKNPVAHNLMGAAYLGLNKKKDAVKQFNKALSANSKFIPAMVNLAQLDEKSGDISKAKKRFEKILAINGAHVGALMSLAKYSEKEGEIDKALSYVEQAKSKNPKNPVPGLFLVRYYLKQNNNLKALSIAREVADTNPKNASALKGLGLAQIAADQKNNALATFTKLTEIYPNVAEGHYLVGKSHLANGEYNKARSALEVARKKDANHIPTLLSFAELELKSKKPGKAIKIAQKIQQQQPKLVVGYELEGDIYTRLKKHKKAVKAYETGFHIAKSSQLLAKLFRASVNSGDSNSKRDLLLKWIKEHPGDVSMMLVLAADYQINNENRSAVKLYKQIVEKNSKHVVALNNLAWLLHLDKDPTGLKYAEMAYNLVPQNAAVADTYGWILVQSNKANKGLVVLQQAALKAPELYDIRYHLAVALNAVGRKDEAKKELTQVLKKKKDFPEIENAKRLLKSLQ